jgi:uncharacterized protein YeaO (DUF488 family)
MLYTASYYAPHHWVGRAYRVSRQHPRGRRADWECLPRLYPARELLRAYRQGRVAFDGFSLEYRRGLDQEYESSEELREWVAASPTLGDFTLLCFERQGEPCHRLVLAQWLLERVPGLAAGEMR